MLELMTSLGLKLIAISTEALSLRCMRRSTKERSEKHPLPSIGSQMKQMRRPAPGDGVGRQGKPDPTFFAIVPVPGLAAAARGTVPLNPAASSVLQL